MNLCAAKVLVKLLFIILLWQVLLEIHVHYLELVTSALSVLHLTLVNVVMHKLMLPLLDDPLVIHFHVVVSVSFGLL
jgi:hypothetical protein